MSRPPKFRAWDESSKKMISSTEIDIHSQLAATYLVYSGCKQTQPLDQVTQEWLDRFRFLHYTGLQDKNGVDTCEGDIVSFVKPNQLFPGRHNRQVGSIFFLDGEFGISPDNFRLSWCLSNLSVIGNIYEHPHLLEAAS